MSQQFETSLLSEMTLTFAGLSLIAIGGANALVPDIHRQVVDLHHWVDSATFANLFAIAQTAPGPNILIVSLIGWQLAGWAGLLVATLAIIGPSSLIAFGAGRALNKFEGARAVKLAKEGLIPIAIGLILASGLVMAKAADHAAVTVLITIGATAYVALSKTNPLWALAGGAAIAIFAAKFGVLL